MGFQEKPFSIYITNKEGTMEFALIKKQMKKFKLAVCAKELSQVFLIEAIKKMQVFFFKIDFIYPFTSLTSGTCKNF